MFKYFIAVTPGGIIWSETLQLPADLSTFITYSALLPATAKLAVPAESSTSILSLFNALTDVVPADSSNSQALQSTPLNCALPAERLAAKLAHFMSPAYS